MALFFLLVGILEGARIMMKLGKLRKRLENDLGLKIKRSFLQFWDNRLTIADRNPDTKYRYFKEETYKTVFMVCMLSFLGWGVDEIKGFLDKEDADKRTYSIAKLAKMVQFCELLLAHLKYNAGENDDFTE